jgi:hypothetical protein
MILIIVGASKGQVGLKPMHLTDQSLSAYSTDFKYGNEVRTYESPNPKNKERGEIWTLEDMLTIDFDQLLEDGGYRTIKNFGGMKSIIKKSDIPQGKSDTDRAIRVRLYMYDPDPKFNGYDPDKKLIDFYMDEDSHNEDRFKFKSKRVIVDEALGKEYDSANIIDVIYNSEIIFGILEDWDGAGIQKVVLRIDFYYPAKIKELRIPGIGEIAPQKLLYSQENSTFDAPSSTEKIVDFLGASDIYRWKWEGDDRLYGTKDNILNIAELDFSADRDLELKLDYVFKDPRSNPREFNPKTYRNNSKDKEPGLLTAWQMAQNESLPEAEYIMIDEPQSGMFDVVSNRAARAGALFAVNGAFYDYYYYCLPGVKTSLKVNGAWRYEPDIFNHRNTGALVFEDNRFEFLKNHKHDEYIDDESGDSYAEAGNAYNELSHYWPNLMSGGHFSELGKPYRFYKPKVHKTLDYFWEQPEVFYPDMPNNPEYDKDGKLVKKGLRDRYKDWNEEEFGIWSMIACQKRDDTGKVTGDYRYTKNGQLMPKNLYSFADAFTPDWLEGNKTSVGVNGETINMGQSEASNLYTAVDYLRYPHEFGVQKRGRTFIAQKGEKLYIMTADGLYAPWCEYGGQSKTEYYAKTAPGLTIDELSDLSQKLEFDALLNLDGGGSSTFFVNGKGMLQNPYAGTAEGPMQQRYLSTTLMVVPKIQENNIKEESDVNSHSLRFNNSGLHTEQFETWTITKCSNPDGSGGTMEIVPKLPYNDWAPVQALSLTPSLDKFTKNDGRAGSIAGSFKTSSDSEGAILFAMSENGQYFRKKDSNTNKDEGDPIAQTRSLFVIGVGKMPEKLIKVLEPFGETIDSGNISMQQQWSIALDSNQQSLYIIFVNNEKLQYFAFADSSFEGSYGEYTDGSWHNFNFYFIEDDSDTIDYHTKIFMDGEEVSVLNPYLDPWYPIDGDTVNGYGVNFFSARHVTHAMIGAIPLQGSYVTGPKSDLTVDNFIFVPSFVDFDNFVKTAASSQQTDIGPHPSPLEIFDVMKIVNEDIAYNNHQLPSKYTGFGWNDPNYNQWYLQFEEGTGYHAHAVNENQVLDESGKPHFYGLNLWGSWVTDNAAKKEVAETAKALDSIVDPITDEPLNANQTLEFGSAGVSHVEEAPDASATNSLTEDTLRHSWNVYPNPASSSLFLDLVLEESTPLDIYLFNLSGQQLFHARSARMERGKNQVDLGEIARRFGGKQQLYTLKVRGNGFAPIDTKVMIK